MYFSSKQEKGNPGKTLLLFSFVIMTWVIFFLLPSRILHGASDRDGQGGERRTQKRREDPKYRGEDNDDEMRHVKRPLTSKALPTRRHKDESFSLPFVVLLKCNRFESCSLSSFGRVALLITSFRGPREREKEKKKKKRTTVKKKK